jgi:hypothetical protein
MNIWPMLGLVAGGALQPLFIKYVIRPTERGIKRYAPKWVSAVLLFKIGKGERDTRNSPRETPLNSGSNGRANS